MCAKIKASDETTSAQVRLTLSLLAITIYASCFTMHNCIMHLFLSPLSHMVHITFSNLSTDFFAKGFYNGYLSYKVNDTKIEIYLLR